MKYTQIHILAHFDNCKSWAAQRLRDKLLLEMFVI